MTMHRICLYFAACWSLSAKTTLSLTAMFLWFSRRLTRLSSSCNTKPPHHSLSPFKAAVIFVAISYFSHNSIAIGKSSLLPQFTLFITAFSETFLGGFTVAKRSSNSLPNASSFFLLDIPILLSSFLT